MPPPASPAAPRAIRPSCVPEPISRSPSDTDTSNLNLRPSTTSRSTAFAEQFAPSTAAPKWRMQTSKPTVKTWPFISSAAQIAAARSIIATIPGVESTGFGSVPPTSVSSCPSTMKSKECSRDKVRVLLLEHLAVHPVHRLRDRDQGERLLHVAARLDAPACDRHRHVLLALEVLVGDVGVHLHLHLGLPVDVVGPLPHEVVAIGRVVGGGDVHHEVEIGELDALRRVAVAQLRPHVGVGAHHLEDAVHDLAELFCVLGAAHLAAA